MMLQYLDTLLRNGDTELEEVPYYESLFLGLYDEARDQELLEFANAMRRRQNSRLQAQAPRELGRRALLGRLSSAVHRRIREYLGNRSEHHPAPATEAAAREDNGGNLRRDLK